MKRDHIFLYVAKNAFISVIEKIKERSQMTKKGRKSQNEWNLQRSSVVVSSSS